MSPAALLRAAAALLALSLAPFAAATAYHEVLSASALDARAQLTVRGVVTALRPEAVGKGLVQTVVTIAVDEVYRGRAGDTVEVVAPGGTLEGRTLSITGAPTFTVGDEVLVFARGRTIVGFGQGAFGVADHVATRSLGNEVEGARIALDLQRAFGRPEVAEDCQHNRLDDDYSAGWTLRGADLARVAAGEDTTWALTLVKGNEYRVQVCADGEAGALGLHLVGSDGVTLARSTGRGRELDLRFTPTETTTYYVVLDVSEHAEGTLRSAAALSVEFR